MNIVLPPRPPTRIEDHSFARGFARGVLFGVCAAIILDAWRWL